MMLGVLQSNRENVLNALCGLQKQLAEIEGALSANDFSKLESILNESNSAYQSLVGN
jgi:prephenate dehydrogenase